MTGKVVRKGQGRSLRVIDEVITFKATAEDTDDGLLVFEDAVAREGAGPPPHIHHDQNEAFYVLEGDYEFTIGETTTEAGPGDFLLGPRGVPHAYRLTRGDRGRLLVFLWPGDGLQRFFEEAGEPVDAPERPPDMGRLLSTARKHGVEILPP